MVEGESDWHSLDHRLMYDSDSESMCGFGSGAGEGAGISRIPLRSLRVGEGQFFNGREKLSEFCSIFEK